jgi:hypothetical protein
MLKKEKIKSIEKINTKNTEVYDIEVDKNHMFFANNILVHNTDSIFLYIKPVLKALYKDKFDNIPDDDKALKTLEIVRKCSEYVNKYVIKNMLDYHNTPSEQSKANKYDFTFKEELIIRRALFLEAKKKYAIWVINKEGEKTDDLSITGMEIVRSDFPRYTRNMMKDVVEKIIKFGYNNMQVIEVVDEYIEDYKKELVKGNFETGVPGVWGAREYKTLTKPIRGMQIYNILFGPSFFQGDKGYVFDVRNINPSKIKNYEEKFQKIKDDGLLLKKNNIDVITIPIGDNLDTEIFYPDIDTMVEKAIYKRLENIIEVFKIDIRNTDTIAW